ncbi:zinc finger protein 131-like isoform X3 [Sipha flava]|uniref:Zinc finger protein 131-like isoform X3 n=1 Tax=Sipha flava TaxID=143950 RepID=A0A8B8G5B5_9HEMI|nr:zinc finger protein 131-like isoform X3 [Sipha flava]
MGVCFICDAKLYGERTRVCSSITPHSNIPYPEKIVELIGEEFVVIVTPADHMCKKCTSLLIHMDKLENDLKLVRNAMLSYIQKKYGIIPPDQPVKTLDTDELEAGQRKVPSGLTVRDSPAHPSMHSPLKMLKTPPPSSDNSSKMKIYKCGFCTFQSKELGHVRFHMRSHMHKKEAESKVNQTAAAKTLTPVTQPQKKRLYRCQVCSKSFDSRIHCLDHIQKDHNQSSTASTTEDKESEENPPDVTKEIFKQEELKGEELQQAESTTMDIDENQDNKGTVDTNMLLNENVPGEGTVEGEQEAVNADEEMPQQEEGSIVSTQQETDNGSVHEQQETETETETETELTQNENALATQDETGEVIPDSVEKGDEDVGNEDTKPGDLDIESMLAAIHNDNPPPTTEDAQEDMV